MSYDITIRPDASFSQFAAKAPLVEFLHSLPKLIRNGDSGFVLDDRPARWMEIALEIVTEEGDMVEEPIMADDAINCVRLHIPYAPEVQVD